MKFNGRSGQLEIFIIEFPCGIQFHHVQVGKKHMLLNDTELYDLKIALKKKNLSKVREEHLGKRK